VKRRRLGWTDLEVSELSLGAMTFGASMPPITTVDEQLARAMADRALEAGVNLIDTADVYSSGESEEILAAILRAHRDELLVATKVGFGASGPHDPGLSYDNVVASAEASLRRLGIDHIDLFQLHRPDRSVPMEETLRALDDLVDRGLVRYFGVSNFTAAEVAYAIGWQRARERAPIAAVQVYYSLVGRDVEHEIVPLCNRQDVGLLVWSPLAGGFLARREGGRRSSMAFPPVDPELGARALDVVGAVADARGVTLAQVSIAWLLAQPVVTSVIVGASTMTQLDDNLAAADLVLTPDELLRLDVATAPVPIYPAWWDKAMGVS
jgi:aryl-alcohol dehydrogenase-like predicted oxidoreductase